MITTRKRHSAFFVEGDAINGQQSFDVVKFRNGVYELDDDKELIVNGMVVDLVVTENNQVIHFCESTMPAEVDEAEVD